MQLAVVCSYILYAISYILSLPMYTMLPAWKSGRIGCKITCVGVLVCCTCLGDFLASQLHAFSPTPRVPWDRNILVANCCCWATNVPWLWMWIIPLRLSVAGVEGGRCCCCENNYAFLCQRRPGFPECILPRLHECTGFRPIQGLHQQRYWGEWCAIVSRFKYQNSDMLGWVFNALICPSAHHTESSLAQSS